MSARGRTRERARGRTRERARGRTRVALALAAGLALLALAGLARAEIVQKGRVRVTFDAQISPKALPRAGQAPVSVSMQGDIATTDRGNPPQLRRIEIAINSAGRFDYAGLPVCTLSEVQPTTTANAMRACGDAKVGEGTFSANVVIPQQSPFPSRGKLVAFNGRDGGRPAILAHVYGTTPVPTSYTLVLRIGRSHGTFGTVLTADLPEVTSDVAFVTGIALKLGRTFTSHGRRHSYVSAGCPAPKGFPGTTFSLARATFTFAAAPTLTKTLTRTCQARG